MALTDKLTAIADSIRRKTGETGQMYLDEMPGKIDNILSEVFLENVAIRKSCTFSRTQEPLISSYSPISFAAGLTDGLADTTSPINPENNSWWAFQTYYNTIPKDSESTYGTVGQITINLGNTFDLRRAKVCLANADITNDTYSFIAREPDKVELLLSEDGITFTPVGNFETKSDSNIAYWSEITFPKMRAKYARIEITINTPNVAAHYALINEIELYAITATSTN